MSRIGLADIVLPTPFKNELERLLFHKGQRTNNNTRNVSHETLSRRRSILMRVFGELYQLGYKLRSPTNLRETHVKALVDHWTATKKCPATIQNNLSVLRMFAGWINKKGMIRESQAYVEDKELVRRSVVAKENRSWNARGVDPLEIIEQARKENERVGLYVRLMYAFGLRLKEAVCLKPIRDVVMEGQWLSARDGTKGGRQRMIPIETDYQRETLKLAQEMADQRTGKITPRSLTLKQAYDGARYRLQKLGITKKELGVTAHGLRHQYAQASYQNLTGKLTPIQGGDPTGISADEHKKACYEVMDRLGHGRVDVGGSYYGSYGHKMRGQKGGPETDPAPAPAQP